MATLGYSSLFSSGLLAPESESYSTPRPDTPDPTTPRSRTITLDETTPTAPTHALPATSSSNNVLPQFTSAASAEMRDAPANPSTSERPRMRRRRSSLGLSASPVTPLKCNTSSARVSASIQRQSLTTIGVASPSRSRAGSVSEAGVLLSRATMSIGNNDATKGNSLMGRLRSGSMGNILRPRRFRKQASLPAPAPPPPTAPLPPLPTGCLPLPLPTLTLPVDPQTSRRPLSRRSQTADSIPLPLHTPTIPFSAGERIAALAGLDSMDIDPFDYPSPLDSPGRVRGGYF